MTFLKRNIKKQFAVNLLSSYSSMAITMGIQLLLVPFIIAGIGLEAYSMFALFIFFSVNGGMSLLDLGLSGTVVKTLSNRIAGGDKSRITSFVFESFSLFVFLGLVFSAVLLVFGLTAAHRIFNIPPAYMDFLPTFFMLASASLLVDFIYIGLLASLESLVRRDLVELLRIIRTVALALLVLVLMRGYGLRGVLLSYLVSNILTTLTGIILVAAQMKPFLTWPVSISIREILTILKESRFLFVSRIVGFLRKQFPKFIVSTLLPITALGRLDIILRLSNITEVLASKISQVGLISYTASLEEKKEKEKMRRLFLSATFYSLFVCTLIVLLVGFFAGDLLKLWLGDEFVHLSRFVRIMMVQVPFINLISVGGAMLIGIHKLRRIIKISLVNAIITAGAMFAATHYFGLPGTLIAFAAGAIVLAPFYLRKLLEEFDVSLGLFLKRVFVPLILPVSLAAAVLTTVIILLDGIPALLTGGLLCGAVYLALFIHFNRQDKIVRVRHE